MLDRRRTRGRREIKAPVLGGLMPAYVYFIIAAVLVVLLIMVRRQRSGGR